MASITLELTEAEITEALRDYVEKQGFATTDRFRASVRTTPGDRPFDSAYTTASLSGVVSAKEGRE